MKVTLALAILLVVSASLSGQVTTATIYGTLSDSSGGIISGASVSVLNEQTGAPLSVSSDPQGEFTLTFLPVGRYSMTVRANGFKEYKRTGLEVTAGQRLRLSVTLELGAISESVSVSAEAPLLQTVTAEQRENVGAKQVRELPVANRDWTSLLRLGPGMAPASNYGGVALNGLPPAGFTFTVDGTDASGDSEMPAMSLYQNWNVIKGVSTEAVAEVSVAKGIASAEIASSMSGNVNVITRSGTNAFHGSLLGAATLERRPTGLESVT
jgi:hypothetical protein